MTATKLGLAAAAAAVLIGATAITTAAIMSGNSDTSADAATTSTPAPAPVESHTITLRAQGASITMYSGGVGHRIPEQRYATTVQITGPVAQSDLSISALMGSCAIDVDGVHTINDQVETGDALPLANCDLSQPTP